MRGRGYGAFLVSCLLLTALFFQVTPFVMPLSVAPADPTADGARQYFEPLQVCGDFQSPGTLLSDIPWISSPPREISSLAEGTPLFAAVCHLCREGFPSPLYRPPRPLTSLS